MTMEVSGFSEINAIDGGTGNSRLHLDFIHLFQEPAFYIFDIIIVLFIITVGYTLLGAISTNQD